MASRERRPLSRGGCPAGDRKVTCRIPVPSTWLGGRRHRRSFTSPRLSFPPSSSRKDYFLLIVATMHRMCIVVTWVNRDDRLLWTIVWRKMLTRYSYALVRSIECSVIVDLYEVIYIFVIMYKKMWYRYIIYRFFKYKFQFRVCRLRIYFLRSLLNNNVSASRYRWLHIIRPIKIAPNRYGASFTRYISLLLHK